MAGLRVENLLLCLQFAYSRGGALLPSLVWIAAASAWEGAVQKSSKPADEGAVS